MTPARLALVLAAAVLAAGLAAAAIGAVAVWAGGVDLPGLLRDPYVRGVTLFTFKQYSIAYVEPTIDSDDPEGHRRWMIDANLLTEVDPGASGDREKPA